DDGRRIGARGLTNDVDGDAPAPRLELLDRCRPEGVRRREQHLPTVALQGGGELGGGGRLPRAVDAEHEHDARPRVEVERLGGGPERVRQEAAEEWSELIGAR